MERKQVYLPTEEVTTNTAMLYQGQLVTTKFLVPVASHTLIPRPRLTALLQDSLKYAFTLVSAPAGFGKTTLLATWGQSLPASSPLLAWVSLDEGDNDPQLFWTYVISALNKKLQPEEPFTPLLKYLQSSQDPSLKYVLRALINLLADSAERFLLILDNYHLITEQEVHAALLYLVEHLPPQLRIILATRADPPLPLMALQARQQVLRVCTNQLRCTVEETRAFFHETMAIRLPDEIIQEITARTEGWLVGLHLLGLAWPDCANPKILLEETSGDQRYILDYLTEEVLRRQPENVQMFLFSTCILENLTASLCDAVMQQKGGQQMLEWLEKANVFISSVDSKRLWYRYHALFAQALRYQLEHLHGDLIPILHHRASLWYAEHGYTTEAILHAFNARQWQWATDLIESIPLISLTWRASEDKISVLRQVLERLPVDLIHSRPRLCLACAQILWAVAPPTKLEAWFDAAETWLTNQNASPTVLAPEEQQEQDNLLGEVFAFRAILQSYQEDGQVALSLCQQALALLSAKNFIARTLVSMAHLQVSYLSSTNDTVAAAIQSGLEAGSLAQAAGQASLAIAVMSSTVMYMIGAGQLHEAQRLSQQAMLLGNLSGKPPEIGYPALFQAEILREWNQLDAALSLAEEGISLCKQSTSIASLAFSLYGHAVLVRIFLSRGELDAARSALQEFERIGRSVNLPTYLHVRSLFTTIDQVRVWLAYDEQNRAMHWAEQPELEQRRGTPFAREREDVAWARILLARGQPVPALERLEFVLIRATTAQRWRHVIEVHILQALAYYMYEQETLALSALSEAVRLAEPEDYICSFVDEGTLMATLLSRLREEQRKAGPTPYLDMLLAAFPQRSAISELQPKRVIASEQLCRTQARGKNAVNEPRPNQITEHMIAQPLVDPLSDRELEVLQLLAHGASNQEIAQDLVIVVNTVKRHVSQIFSKLAVKNRVQAVRRARELELLSEES